MIHTEQRSPLTRGMDFQQAALVACGGIAAYFWYKLSHTFTISDVPGPKNPSWIYGIFASLMRDEVFLPIWKQGTYGGGCVKKRELSRRASSKNTEQLFAGTDRLG